ncbi:MAG TPA: formate dehydrogenase accessory sulfurtransferase FdhD [Luteolibacter sp.]|nr:formate dehydrogenase accessory sulfurtransferase FdhD [Luteolibacter sp.]
MDPVRRIFLTRNGGTTPEPDHVAVEEPLELRLDGHPVSILMRTPGHDEELAAGFLLTEGLVASPAQIRKIEPRPEENRILVFLSEGTEIDMSRLTRHLFTGSSCGLCGKTTLEAILQISPPITKPLEISREAILASPGKLRAAQSAFAATGGLHAAGLFSADGDLLISYEDIGRHNAVDKVIGRAFLDGLAMDEMFLLVSGRASFEILQKSLAARIPLVAAVSAPSSLAVEFARNSGQTLVGFLRPPDFNIYQ